MQNIPKIEFLRIGWQISLLNNFLFRFFFILQMQITLSETQICEYGPALVPSKAFHCNVLSTFQLANLWPICVLREATYHKTGARKSLIKTVWEVLCGYKLQLLDSVFIFNNVAFQTSRLYSRLYSLGVCVVHSIVHCVVSCSNFGTLYPTWNRFGENIR